MSRNGNNYSFRSKSGQKIQVRRLRADDTPLLVDVFEHMTSESRYRRFHQALDHVPSGRVWQEAKNIAEADPDHNLGLLALINIPDEGMIPIGAARFVATSPEEAEVAISIRDDYHNKGIGTRLMRLLAEEAQTLGYRHLTAGIQNDNPAIWQVFKNLPYNVERSSNGSYSDILISLSGI